MADKSSFDLLLADHAHFSESLWRNEEMGEKRFNFFLTLVTAVLAGVVAAHGSGAFEPATLHLLRRIATAAVLIVGVWTFLRMLKRNRVTDEYKSTLGYIRELLARHLAPPMPDYRVPRRPDGKARGGWVPSGGLAETVAVINALLAVLLTASWGQDWSLALMIGAAVFGIQILAVSRRSTAAPDADQYFRVGVGAVIVSPDGRVLGFQRPGYPEWQLPQGGLMVGEDPDVAVRRELEEETGLTGDDVEMVGRYPEPLPYELPPAARSAKNGRGQVHYWYFFAAASEELPVDVSRGGELGAHAWLGFHDLVDWAVDFKQPTYRKLSVYWEEILAAR